MLMIEAGPNSTASLLSGSLVKSLQSYFQVVKQKREPVCVLREQGDCSGHEEG